jgi:hypothetical protein
MKLIKRITAFLGGRYRAVADFFRCWHINLIMSYTTFLARDLDKCLQYLGKLGALDLSQPLLTLRAPPRPPTTAQPTIVDALTIPARRQFQFPYIPTWVAASFKDPKKHPGFGGAKLIKDSRPIPDFLKKDEKSKSVIFTPLGEAMETLYTEIPAETKTDK